MRFMTGTVGKRACILLITIAAFAWTASSALAQAPARGGRGTPAPASSIAKADVPPELAT